MSAFGIEHEVDQWEYTHMAIISFKTIYFASNHIAPYPNGIWLQNDVTYDNI